MFFMVSFILCRGFSRAVRPPPDGLPASIIAQAGGKSNRFSVFFEKSACYAFYEQCHRLKAIHPSTPASPVPLRRQAAFPLRFLPFQGRKKVVVTAASLAPLKGNVINLKNTFL
ncbi:MAG: hypothetical protein LUE61_08020, partial [Clostridiales bacterium]|nr:hypothetical protein [Clostridiales bacterium]